MRAISSWQSFIFGIKAFFANPTLLFFVLLTSCIFLIVGFVFIFLLTFFICYLFTMFTGIACFISEEFERPVIFLTLFMCLKKIGLVFVNKKKFSAFSIFLPFTTVINLIAGGTATFVLLFAIGEYVNFFFVELVGYSFGQWDLSLTLYYISLLLPIFSLAIYFLFKFYFFQFFIIEKNLGVIESLKKSFHIRSGGWKLFQLWVIYGLFMLAPSVVAFVIWGQIFTDRFWLMPVIFFYIVSVIFALCFSEAHLYKELTKVR